MPRFSQYSIIALAFSISFPAHAATPDSFSKLDKASEAACIKAANLLEVNVGAPVRFSDRTAVEARVVTGTWPQPHMKGAKARMLCLYNRKNKRAEVQEFAEPVAATPVAVKDVWWRAAEISGAGIVDNSEITLMLGSDGKIGGKSGCNGYSANYQLNGEALKIIPPMIGTRMMCAPALMDQEQAYRSLLENAASFAVMPDGSLTVRSANGSSGRFVRK